MTVKLILAETLVLYNTTTVILVIFVFYRLMCVKSLRLSYDLGYIFLQIVGSRTGQQNFGGTVPANTLTYLSPMLAPYAEYIFQVTAINGAGDGMPSTAIPVRTNFSGML